MLKRSSYKIVCVALLVMIIPQTGLAQADGKLTGRVTDAQTGEALIGANILVQGTSIGAATDQEGRFIILRVPPGDYGIEAQHIGYQRMVIRDVEVLTDLTTTVDFLLSAQALVAAEEIIVTAERPLVRMDLTSVESRVQAEEIARMPVETLGDLLDMQAGITRDAGGGIHIRGGRTSEVAYMVNGISITDDYYKNQALTIENDAVQELQVISGTFNAEYGNAMSGIINIVTKYGGNTLHGRAEARIGDYLSNREGIFWNIDRLNPLAVNSLQLSLGGPLIRDKLTFYASGRRYENDGWIYGPFVYSPQGRTQVINGDTSTVSGDSSAVPMNSWERLSGQLALKWQLSNALSFKLDLIGSQSNGRPYRHVYRLNPHGYGYTDSYGLTTVGKFTHQLNPRTFYEISLAYKVNESSYSLYPDPADSRYVHPDSVTYPDYTYAQAGTDLGFSEHSSTSEIIKWDLTSQVSRHHQLKTGWEYQADKVFFEDYTLVPAQDSSGLQIEPFEPIVMPTTELSHDRFTRTPDKFAAYVQDKVEYENVIINVGLRFDAFWANGHLVVDREDPNVYMPFKLDHKYKDLNGDGVIELSEQVEENEYSLEERKDFWYRAVEAKYQVSPRFGIAYPITDRGVIHFSYGIFQQIPEYSQLYDGDERKISEAAETYGPFGNPDLNPQKTTMYELGINQQLSEDLAINITGFYRDIRDWISTGPSIPTVVAGVSYVTRINRDVANVRGITVMVDRRLSSRISFKGDYTLQIVEGTNSAPEDEFWAQLEGAEPTRQLAPLDWDQRHTLNLNLFFKTRSSGATILARYNSGQPYSPEILTGERAGRSIIMGLAENSRRKPPRFTVDINAFSQFQLGEGAIRLSVQMYNLIDAGNPSTVFSDSGEAGYTIRQDQVVQADPGYFIRPDYYAEPRQVILEISYGF